MRGITEERVLFIHSFISVIYSLQSVLFTFTETSHNASVQYCEFYNCVRLQETSLGGGRTYTCQQTSQDVPLVSTWCYVSYHKNIYLWGK